MFGFGTRKKQITIEPRTFVVRVRDDVMPRVNNAVQQAIERSAPARTEAKARTSAAWQALRGDLTVPEPPKKRGKAPGVIVSVIGTMAAVGAATWGAARRLRTPEWVSQGDESTDLTSSTTPADEPPSIARTSARTKSKRASNDAAGASPDEVLADMAESSHDGLRSR